MKKRYLLILTLFGIGIYGLTQFSTYTSAEQFSTHLLPLDSSQISQIIIHLPNDEGQIQFHRLPARSWQVMQANITTTALQETVNDLLSELDEVRTARIVTNQAKEWDEFGVGVGSLRLEIIKEDDTSEQLFLGGKNMPLNVERDTTFARIPDENEVYALVEFNRQIFARPFHFYRQKEVVQITDSQKINQVVLIGKDTLLQTADGWRNKTGSLQKMENVAAYLHQLDYVEAQYFADDFDETQTVELPVKELIISGDNITPAIQIKAYYDSTATTPFIIHSSQFPTVFYASDSSGLYQQLFGYFDESF